MNWLIERHRSLFDLVLGALRRRRAGLGDGGGVAVDRRLGPAAVQGRHPPGPAGGGARPAARPRLRDGPVPGPPGVLARIQRDLARANLRYLGLTLPALLALALPMVLTLAQLDSRYGHRPLRPGETTVFSVTLAAERPAAWTVCGWSRRRA